MASELPAASRKWYLNFLRAHPALKFSMFRRTAGKAWLQPRRRRGVASIYLILALPVVLMLAWLGVEFGFAVRAYAQAKTAADAVALAAAARYPDGVAAALNDAVAAASSNRGPNGPIQILLPDGGGLGGDLLFGHWDEETRQFMSSPSGGPAVWVRVRFASDHPNGPLRLLLAGLFGNGPYAIERHSVAVHRPSRHTTSLLVAGAGPSALQLSDSAELSSGAGLAVGSLNVAAVVVTGKALLSAPVVRIAGDLDAASQDAIQARVLTSAEVPEDPKAATGLPAWSAGVAAPIAHDDVSITRVPPGLHDGLVASGGTVLLEAGLHQFSGPVYLSGTAELQLEGAAIQLAGGALFKMTGNSRLTGTPDESLPDWGRCWALQRGAPSVWEFHDSAFVDVRGRFYAPTARLVVDGAAQANLDAAVLLELELAGLSHTDFAGRLQELDLPAEPGRARLVR